MTVILNDKNNKIIWPVNILKFCLPIFFITFFGQTLLLIISLFECRDGKTYYDSESNCREGIFFYILTIFSILILIIQFFFAFLTSSMYYKSDFINFNKNEENVLRKRNSYSEIVFLLCKIIIIFIFVFDSQTESLHWGIIIFLSILTGYNAYCNLFLQNYINITIKLFNNFLSLTLFWAYFTLLIEKIFQTFDFSGGIYLFIFGIILIIIFCFYYKQNSINFLMINFININNSYNCLNYINQYLKLINEKDISRDSLLIFNSFLEKLESSCTNNRCALKKYIESSSKGIHSKFLLLQYAEKLFKIAITRFPKDIILRINYVIFLYTKINKRKEAKKELILIKPNLFSFNDNFNLYVCKKYLENYSYINIQNEEKYETVNMLKSLEYKDKLNKFKNLIYKSSSLYYDFWSSLYNSHIQGIEDFSKLSEIGNQLNDLIENIEKTFNKLNEINKNDYEVIKLYETFIKNILNDNEKYKKYHNISINLVIDRKSRNKEVNFENFDLKILNECDENKYIIISMNEDNKGIITNISLSACLIFGYHKDEIIGKNMNILIPELFQHYHDKTFNELTEKSKANFFDNLVNKKIYKPEFNEIYAHGKNKSKYLIPLYFKIYLVQTEESELVYIVEISRNDLYIGELNGNFKEFDNNNNNNEIENICCVLTDNNLIIQTFTTNCIDLLKLNSNIINANYDISSFIKQFNDDFQNNNNSIMNNYADFELSEITESNGTFINPSNKSLNKNNLIEKKIKRKILKSYSYPNKITWKIEFEEKGNILNKKTNKKRKSLFLNESIFEKNKNIINNINENKYEENFLMQVREAYISNNHVGYFFYFKKYKFNLFNNNNNEYNKNSTLKIYNKSRTKMSIKSLNIKRNNSQDENIFKSNKLYEEESSYINKGISRKSSMNTPYSPKRATFNLEKLNIKRIKSVNAIINEKEKQFENNISCKYIPECNFNFMLDISLMSYLPSNSINNNLKLNEILKNEAINIINIIQKNKKKKDDSSSSILSKEKSSNIEEEIEDEDEEEEEDSNEEEDEYENNLIFKKEELKTNKNKRKTLINENFNKNYEGYYKVNLNNIKFMIYDFNQEMLIENFKEGNKYKIESIINEYKLRANINITEDYNYNFHNFVKDKKDKNEDINKEKQKNKLIEINDNKKINDQEYENEIINALSKKDEQRTIINFYFAAFFSLILFLLMNILCIYYLILKYLELKENMILFIYSINLKYYNNYNIYFLRELSLYQIVFTKVSNSTYINVPAKNKNESFIKLYDIANKTFGLYNSILEASLCSNLVLSKNANFTLNEMKYIYEIIYNNQISKVESTLSVSLIQITAIYCNLLSTSSFNLYNTEIFNYIHNGMNSLGNAFEILIDLYMLELKEKEKKILYNIIFIIIYNIINYIIIFFITNITYIAIVKKKMSYFSVFYGIKISLIKSTIKKCEIFINKINQDDFEKTGNINDDEDESNNIISLFNTKMKIIEERTNKNISKNIKKSIKIKKKKDFDKKARFFQILFIIFLLLSFIYLSIIIITYTLLINKFIYNAEYILHLQNYHNNILYLYNAYREFLFDENSIIFGMSSYDYLIKQENNLYSTCTDDIEILTSKNSHIKEIFVNFIEFNYDKVCNSFILDYFDNSEECYNFIGGKEGIVQFGFHFLIHDFIEEIRMKRNYAKILFDNKRVVGNFTNVNIYADEIWDDEYFGLNNNTNLIFRINLFNMEKTHSRINIIFIHIILQYIDAEKNLILNLVEDNTNNKHITYIILILCHIIFVILSITLFWVPKIKKMNIEIYKAKNILSIIPVKILASLPNIKTLLNLSSKSSQYINQF